MPSGVYTRTPEMKAARFGRKVSEEQKLKQSIAMKERAKDPEWRKLVSDRTKERMWDPEIRERHLIKLTEAFALTENGNHWNGGQGQEPNELQQLYADLLIPLGYETEYIVQWGGRGERYRLDFALVEEKIDIEIDGSSHAGKEDRDDLRDAILRIFGWKIIRINHVRD